MMKRRRFLGATGAIGLAATLRPLDGFAQAPVARFADMHSHLMRRQALVRDALARNGMLVVAEKVIPDGPLLRLGRDRIYASREAQPGEMRKSYETQFANLRQRVGEQGLTLVNSVDSLDRVLKERTPSIALASEGADFLEGDLSYLDRMRAEGLVVLQLVHYRVSDVGDICTEEPKHGGLTAFGKDVVRACNRLGIVVDVAHCTSSGIEQALDAATQPLIYSHGHVSDAAPNASMGGIRARAIHAPLARRVADKGGVIGLWPLRSVFNHIDFYADELMKMVKAYGANHVGIGTDLFGLPSTVIPGYEQYGELVGLLGKRGLDAAGVEAVLGGNFIRVLRQALAA